jgi:hypothetical protein
MANLSIEGTSPTEEFLPKYPGSVRTEPQKVAKYA